MKVGRGARSGQWRASRIWLLGLPAIAGASAVYAQPPQPGGTAGDQFELRERPRSEPVAPYRIERPQAGSAFPGTQFRVERIVVEGADGLDAGALAGLTAPLEGRSLTLADLAALADRITALYAARGYALSFAFVPEQTVSDGVVRLRVVEGAIDAIAVEFRGGAGVLAGRRRVEAAIRRRFQPLVGAGPLRTADLERAALTVNDLAGVGSSVILRPSESTEGAATLVIVVTLDPFDIAIGADNRLRAEFGREEAFATLAVNSALTVGDRLSLTGRRTLGSDGFGYGGISYESQLGHSDLRGSLFYSHARTEAKEGLLGLLEFAGREDLYRAAVSYPVIRSRSRSLYVTAELGGIDTRSNLLGVTVVRDRVRTAGIGVAYDWADATGATSLATLRFVQGLTGLGATSGANPLRSRAQGEPDAAYGVARLYRDQPLPGGFRLRADTEAQFMLHGRSLLAASECSFGGPALGRGYDAGAISGDECWRGGLELARPVRAGEVLLEPYVFIDGGLARQSGILEPGEPRDTEAASFGAGLRLFARFGLSADLQIARTARTLFAGDENETRIFFNISFQR